MNNIKPIVSVITPTYNSARFIKETIESVQNQIFNEWELIIVDDGSTDNTIDLVKEKIKKDKRVKLLINDINIGAAKSRNKAIKVAAGRYIAFLDSDDLWLPNKLEVQVNFMEEKRLSFSFTSYQFINENGVSLNKTVKVPPQITYNELLKNTIIGCLTVMIDISKLGKITMPDIRTRQDTAMWLKILKSGEVAYGIDEPLARYRKVGNSLSSNKYKMAYKTWRMYRDVEKLSLMKTVYVFSHYAYNASKKNL